MIESYRLVLAKVLYPLCRNQVLLFPVVSPPSECPMHKAEAGPAHQDRAYEFVQCPMKAAAGVNSDIDPANMVPALFYCRKRESGCWVDGERSERMKDQQK